MNGILDYLQDKKKKALGYMEQDPQMQVLSGVLGQYGEEGLDFLQQPGDVDEFMRRRGYKGEAEYPLGMEMTPGIDTLGDAAFTANSAEDFKNDPTLWNAAKTVGGGILTAAPFLSVGSMRVLGEPWGAKLLPEGRVDPTLSTMMDEPVSKGGVLDISGPTGLEHADVPKQGAGRRGQLTKTEKQLFESGNNSLTKVNGKDPYFLDARPKEMKDLAERVKNYRRTHSPSDGWQAFEVTGIKRNKSGELTPTYSTQGYLKGKMDPEMRADTVQKISDGIYAEVSDVVTRAKAGDPNAKFILQQKDWYKDVSKKLHDTFGDETTKYTQIQGAMSPNTELSQQFKYGDEFFHRAMRGDFDKNIKQLKKHLADGGNWQNIKNAKGKVVNPKGIPEEIIPLRDNGKKYGLNGKNALMVMIDEFDKLAPGMGPKMRNFTKNLYGESKRPTIDIWAGRTAQRMAGGDRIIPEINKIDGGYDKGYVDESGGILFGEEGTGPWKGHIKPDVTGAYGIGLEGFEDAAVKLDMDASDLQALMWFKEKELWEGAGLTNAQAKPSLINLVNDEYPGGVLGGMKPIKLRGFSVAEDILPTKDPAKNFLEEFKSSSFENPMDPKSRIVMNSKLNTGDDFANVDITKVDGHTVRLSAIQSSRKGKGNGREALNEIIKLADKNNTNIELNPSSFGKTKGLSTTQLKKWYERNGFIGSDKGRDILIRKPQNE